MADLVAIGTGLLSAAGTWGLVDTVSKNVSTNTGQTALTTGNLDSATFVLPANALAGVAVRLSSRAAGTPVTTLTVTLRNSTTGTDARAVTANVSALPACTTGAASEGGWHYFKFATAVTPNGTDSYLIRMTISATTIATGFCTNGVANNWQRLLVRSTTQAPAAGDDMYLAQLLDGSANPATPTALTVTMDSVAATDFGSASTSQYTPALSISKGSVLTWGVVAATNYILQLSGQLVVFSGGTYNQGTVANPVPTGGSAVLQFDCAADGNFGCIGRAGSTCLFQGSPRTAGKAVVSTLLNANAAAAAVSLTVVDDTGWLSGDDVALGTTTQTPTQNETKALTGNATATTMAITAITNAHNGTSPTQGEVVLLTRNVQVKTVTAAQSTFCIFTGSVDADWCDFRYCSSATVVWATESVTGGNNTISFNLCAFRDWESAWNNIAMLVGATFSMTNCVAYNCGSAFASWYNHTSANTCAATTLTGNVFLATQFSLCLSFTTIVGLTLTNNRIAGGSTGLTIAPINFTAGYGATATFSGNTYHGGGTGASYSGVSNLTIASETSWRNATGTGIASCNALTFTSGMWFGNVASLGQISVTASTSRLTLSACTLSGDTTFASSYGLFCSLSAAAGFCPDWRLLNCSFGVATGIKVAHATADLAVSTNGGYHTLIASHTAMGSTTKIHATGLGVLLHGSYLAFEHYNAIAADNRVFTRAGNLTIETTTVDVTPALKMTPADTVVKLESHAGIRGRGYLVPVASGGTVTPSVKVRKDGTYAGNAPRLVVKANPAVGILVDAVLDTLSVGANTWETLTAAAAAATADGVLEFVVDCDGVAGNVYVDTWSQSGGAASPTSLQYWLDGLPADLNAAGGAAAAETSHAFFGMA